MKTLNTELNLTIAQQSDLSQMIWNINKAQEMLDDEIDSWDAYLKMNELESNDDFIIDLKDVEALELDAEYEISWVNTLVAQNAEIKEV